MTGTTRKSISVKGVTYQRLKTYAEEQGRSSSGLLEEFIEEKMTELGVPSETTLLPKPLKTPKVTHSGRFTF